MNDRSLATDHAIVEFPELKLKAGASLQLQGLGRYAPDCEAEFAAALHGISLFVSMPEKVLRQHDTLIGARYLVRGLNGESEFAFTAEVLLVQETPFPHVQLAYPDAVEIRAV